MPAFESPSWLWLLPLALLPLWAGRSQVQANTWQAQQAADAASEVLQWTLRAAAVLALAALLVGIAGPYRPEVQVERIGRGAEIVLVLDRSRSMDEGFAGARPPQAVGGTGPEALDYYAKLRAAEWRESKGKVARRLLAEFTAQRPQDRFGMVVFSTLPMRVLEFTGKQEAIQAAISAGNVGRGLSETNIALALEAALGYFEGRPYTGSRLLLLVSDGGDRIDPDARERITHLARKYRVAVDWIYLRSPRSPGLALGSDEAQASADSVPEYFLHRFFESMGVPYHVYEADTRDALQRAIDDVGRLQNLPITTFDTLPLRALSPWAFGLALAAVLMLLAADVARLRP